MSEERLWSVTTILGEGLPKPALVGWAAKVTAEWAVDNVNSWRALAKADREACLKLLKDARWRSSGQAAARGTEVHRIAEALMLDQPVDIPDEVAPYVDQYRRFLDQHTPTFELAEAPVYNRTYHYAGTLDAIAVVDGCRCVLDMKTTPRAPGEGARPPYADIALQLCAYSRAEFVGMAPAQMREYGGRRYYIFDAEQPLEPMPDVEGALALVVSPHDYTLTPVRVDDEVWNVYLYVREVARWSLDTSKRVLGPAVAARKEAIA